MTLPCIECDCGEEMYIELPIDAPPREELERQMKKAGWEIENYGPAGMANVLCSACVSKEKAYIQETEA